MCLDTFKTPSERKEWLDKKPDTFVIYKTVILHKGEYYPAFHSNDPFKTGVNEIRKAPDYSIGYYSHHQKRRFYYLPYFHLFLSKKGAKWGKGHNKARVILKCRVNKKDIKTVGKQWGYLTIVTRKFEILGEIKCA